MSGIGITSRGGCLADSESHVEPAGTVVSFYPIDRPHTANSSPVTSVSPCLDVLRHRGAAVEFTDESHYKKRTEGTAGMKRLAIFTLVAAGVMVAMRKMAQTGGSAVRARCSEMCDRMLNQMPESFPPNRMMSDLQFLKEQTARILDVLEHQTES